MSKIIIVSAPSGTGKTTLVSRVMQNEDLKLKFSVSATTRQPRGKEVNGKDYYFLSVDEFKKKIEDDQFVEYEQVYEGRFYGTLKSEIQRISDMGCNIIFDVDVEGGINMKNKFQDQALSIFIQPPSVEELRPRLIKRATDSMEEIEKRVSKAEKEISRAPKFDIIVTNDDLDRAYGEFLELIRKFLNS